MQKNNISADAKDSNGMPPFHVAMMNNQLKFAEWLLNESNFVFKRFKCCFYVLFF